MNIFELPYLEERPKFGGSGTFGFDGEYVELICWSGYNYGNKVEFTEIRPTRNGFDGAVFISGHHKIEDENTLLAIMAHRGQIKKLIDKVAARAEEHGADVLRGKFRELIGA